MALPPVIFVIAHDQIAAIDYLLKPVTKERFALAFNRAICRLRDVPQEESTRQVLAMLDAVAKPPRKLERFAIRSGERTIFVPVDEVDWIEAFENYVRLHTGPATHLLHVPMNTIGAAPAISQCLGCSWAADCAGPKSLPLRWRIYRSGKDIGPLWT